MSLERETGSSPPESPTGVRQTVAPLPQDVLDRVADAVITLDTQWRLTSLNRSARTFLTRLGRSPAAMLGQPLWESVRELRGTPVEEAVRHVVAAQEEARLEFHFPPTDGWYAIRLAPLPSGVVAFVLDVTAAHREARERVRAEQAEQRSRRILESIGDAFCVVDDRRCVVFGNARLAELAGVPVEALVGRAAWQLLPGGAGSRLDARLRQAQEQRRTTVFELPLDTRPELWLEVHANPTPDGMAVHLYDVTERMRAEARLRFLTTVSAELGSSLDPQATLERLARLVVPTIADGCAIYLVDEQGVPRGVTGWSSDPALRELARSATAAHRPADEGEASLVFRTLRTGEPQYLPELPPTFLQGITASPELRARVERRGPRSLLVVPLVAREATIGALALTLGHSSGAFDAADQEIAVEVGRRAAIAIDNARLYRQAVEANAAKSTFLAVMSHELRTPLTAIIGYTELMADEVVGPVNETQREQLDRVAASGAHLLTLIEEILAFARLEAGQESLLRQRVDVGEIVREARAVVEPLLRRKALALRLEVAEPAPVIESDPGKLRQILLNLLANAIKFTDTGEVRIAVARAPGERCQPGTGGDTDASGEIGAGGDGGSAGCVVITVADTGVGIAPVHLERIFESFWQVEHTATRRHGGTGLGLSVARQLARLLGGELTVASTAGEGTTFQLRLPDRPAVERDV